MPESPDALSCLAAGAASAGGGGGAVGAGGGASVPRREARSVWLALSHARRFSGSRPYLFFMISRSGTLAAGHECTIIANNKAEGSAPLTLIKLAQAIISTARQRRLAEEA